MANEEIRGLMHRKASEDQFTAFVSSSLELSHFSLYLSHFWSLRVFLEHSSLEKGMEKKARIKEGKQDQVASAGILTGNLLNV